MSLTQEQRTTLEKLIEEKGDEVLLFDTPSFNPRNPYLRKNLRKYLGCNIIGNHYLIIKYKDEVIQEKFPTPEHSFSIKEEELKKLG